MGRRGRLQEARPGHGVVAQPAGDQHRVHGLRGAGARQEVRGWVGLGLPVVGRACRSFTLALLRARTHVCTTHTKHTRRSLLRSHPLLVVPVCKGCHDTYHHGTFILGTKWTGVYVSVSSWVRGALTLPTPQHRIDQRMARRSTAGGAGTAASSSAATRAPSPSAAVSLSLMLSLLVRIRTKHGVPT